MTVLSLKTENSRVDGVVTVELSDGSSFLMQIDYLDMEKDPSASFAVANYTGRELSSGEEEAFRFAAVCYQAEKTSLRLIARAEQSSFGLVAKLERRGFGANAAKAVVSCLLKRNLLDDERYAELWIRSRLTITKAPSPQWLLAALSKRGISRNSSSKAIEKVLDPETEYNLLLRYLSKARHPKRKKAFSTRVQLKHEGFSSAALDRYFDSQ